MTDRYKLVCSPKDRPWLFDLTKDPDEVTNVFNDPEYRDVARELAAELAEYASRFNDSSAEGLEIAVP